MDAGPQELKQVGVNQGGQYRWVAITALLLAIGTILRLVSPPVGGVTINWSIAMYCIAIILTRPNLGQAAGIGLVAGAIAVVTSKSMLPYANLISEPVGAMVCCLIVKAALRFNIGGLRLQPAICGLISTLASGFTFVTLMFLILSVPLKVYLYVMLPTVAMVAGLNMIVTQVLYFPAARLFAAKDER